MTLIKSKTRKDKDPFTKLGVGNSDTVAILPIRRVKGQLTGS